MKRIIYFILIILVFSCDNDSEADYQSYHSYFDYDGKGYVLLSALKINTFTGMQAEDYRHYTILLSSCRGAYENDWYSSCPENIHLLEFDLYFPEGGELTSEFNYSDMAIYDNESFVFRSALLKFNYDIDLKEGLIDRAESGVIKIEKVNDNYKISFDLLTLSGKSLIGEFNGEVPSL